MPLTTNLQVLSVDSSQDPNVVTLQSTRVDGNGKPICKIVLTTPASSGLAEMLPVGQTLPLALGLVAPAAGFATPINESLGPDVDLQNPVQVQTAINDAVSATLAAVPAPVQVTNPIIQPV